MTVRFAREIVGRVLLVSVTLLFGSCGSSVDTSRMEAQADALYQARAENRIEDMLNMYSDEFYQHVPRDEWSETLAEISATLGQYRTRTFVKPIILSSMKKGATVTLIYDVEYENHRVVEQISFRAGRNDEPDRLIHHQFNTDVDLPGEPSQ